MSELQAFEVNGKALFGRTYTKKAYYKDDVDKVIAEKDEAIRRLEEQVREERSAKVDYKISANDLNDGLRKAYAEVAALTHKRCLDKAKWCDERIARYTLQQEIQGISWQKEIRFYRRLKDKFIEISKRFEADAARWLMETL